MAHVDDPWEFVTSLARWEAKLRGPRPKCPPFQVEPNPIESHELVNELRRSGWQVRNAEYAKGCAGGCPGVSVLGRAYGRGRGINVEWTLHGGGSWVVLNSTATYPKVAGSRKVTVRQAINYVRRNPMR